MARRRRQEYTYERSEDGGSSDDSDQDTELDEQGQALAVRDNEDALVDSAMRRIRRAQASGKQDVKLSKKELSALESWRKRQAEASGEKKKKKREQRYAVPLSQLGPISPKENWPSRPAAIPPQPSNEMLNRAYGQRLQPPVGRFAHPSSSRPSTSESRRPPSSRSSDREHSSSPFQYNYVQPSSPIPNPRHTSDSAGRTRSARTSVSQEDGWAAHYNPSASASTSSVPASLDPFRFMTSGPPTAYHAGSITSQRNVSTSSMSSAHYDDSRPVGPSQRRSRRFTPDEEESASEYDDDDDDTSDEVDAGARIGSSHAGPSAGNGREQIVVKVAREPTPEPRMTRSKKASTSGASPKRKAVGSGNNRKKKGGR